MLAEIFVEVLSWFIVPVFYWPGRVILKVVTFGMYPPPIDQKHSEEFVGSIGFIVSIAVVLGAWHVYTH